MAVLIGGCGDRNADQRLKLSASCASAKAASVYGRTVEECEFMRCWPYSFRRTAPMTRDGGIFVNFPCGDQCFLERGERSTPLRVPFFPIFTVCHFGFSVVMAGAIVDGDTMRFAGVNPICCHCINPPRWGAVFPQTTVKFARRQQPGGGETVGGAGLAVSRRGWQITRIGAGCSA